MVEPGRAVSEPWVDPVPGLGFGLAVVGGVSDGRDCGLGPGLRLGEAEFRAVFGRPAVDAVHSRRPRQTHDAVGADPADQLDGEVTHDPGQAGDVIAGVADDHDMRVTGLPLARGDEPLHDARSWAAVTAVASSAGPSRTASRIAVQDVAPGSSTATKE